MVSEPHRGQGHHRDTAAALQRGQAALQPWIADTEAVQGRAPKEEATASINPPSHPQQSVVLKNRQVRSLRMHLAAQ